MNEPPVLPTRTCEHCGTNIPAHAANCWLCSGGNPYASSSLTGRSDTEPRASLSERRVQGVCTALLGVSVVLAVLVGIGFAVQDPGMLVPYAIVIGPPLLATLIRVVIEVGSRKPLKPSSLLLTMYGSFAITVGVIALLFVAALAALFVICTSQFR